MIKNLLAPHLVAAFPGEVSEDGTTPYTKYFEPSDDVVDFYADDALLHTIAIGNYNTGADPETAMDGIILENAILDSFTMTFNNNDRGIARLGRWSGTWVGNEMNFEQNFDNASTAFSNWAAAPTTGFYNEAALGFAFSITLGSDAYNSVCWKSFSITVNNNVTSECKTAGGKANNYLIMPEITFTVDLPYNSGTYTILKNFQDGEDVNNLLFLSGDGSSDGHLKIYNTEGVLTANPFEYNGEYQAIRLQGKLLRPAAGWSSLITMADAVDWSY